MYYIYNAKVDMKYFIFFLFFTIIYISGKSQDWKNTYIITPDSCEYFYYTPSLKITSHGNRTNIVRVWAKQCFKNYVKGNATYENGYTKTLWEFDCKRDQYCILQVIRYSETGYVIDSFTYNEEWDDAVPESIGELLNQYFCKKNRN
jgi:hypothetical protein